jgi:hypothetical protein
MGQVGISNGMSRFGVSGPVNSIAPAGANRVTNSQDVAWYESGPFWVLVFLAVGYILVFQTLK